MKTFSVNKEWKNWLLADMFIRGQMKSFRMKGNGIRFKLNFMEEKKDARMVNICIQDYY